MQSGDSFTSLLTPAGRGAVAVVAATGPAVWGVVAACFRSASGSTISRQSAGRVLFGRWRHRSAADAGFDEEAIVCPLSGDELEVHCHGGEAASTSVFSAFVRGGCTPLSWEQWLERSCGDRLQAEARIALASAPTRRTAAILLDQLHGALRNSVNEILDRVQHKRLAEAQRMLGELTHRIPLGRHLVRPWRVAIAGRPNAGKSSLMNALAGYARAIVHAEPGTTRDVVSAELAVDGWPVRLTDSAGIRETACDIESQGVELARGQLQSADLVLWVIDAAELGEAGVGDARNVEEFAGSEITRQSALPAESAPLLAVVNKIDVAQQFRDMKSGDAVAFISATTGAGIDALLATISRRLVPLAPSPLDAVPFTERQFAALERSAAALARGEASAAEEPLRSLLTGQ